MTIVIIVIITLLVVFYFNSFKAFQLKKIAKGHQEKAVTSYHLGRFKFKLDNDFVIKTEHYSIDHITFKEINWKSPSKWQYEADKIIKKRIKQISNNYYSPEGFENVIIGTKLYNSLPNVGLIIYFEDEADSEYITLEMFCAYSNGGLWLQSSGLRIYQDQLVKELKDIAKLYFPNKTDFSYKKNNNYFSKGGVAIDSSFEEHIFLAFANNNLALSIDTKINESGITRDLFKDMDNTFSFKNYIRFGIQKKVLRKHHRTIAGIKGQELLLKIKEKGKTQKYYFIFKANGKLNSALYPNIILELNANGKSELKIDEMIFIWDTFLDSFTQY